ncbi:MAG: antitoxin Xre/MbcA/ParS toxin-binding domain-containing protein [Balneolaceae bacterium]|nr:antitoxin Xre/MbcA/ParS toxin-binding domain-containing protein [Balneolaceae bacterium]
MEKENQANKNKSNKVEEPYVAWDLSTAAANIRNGLATDILKTIQTRLNISKKELSQLLTISPRTIDRRRKEAVLPADESERSYRIARLTDLAAGVFGNMEKASKWFKEPNYALGNQKPIELMKTEPGARLVERTLHQIDHGITV